MASGISETRKRVLCVSSMTEAGRTAIASAIALQNRYLWPYNRIAGEVSCYLIYFCIGAGTWRNLKRQITEKESRKGNRRR